MMKRLIVALALLLPALAQRGIACDFCNCLMGINPYYESSDKILLHYLLQRSASGYGSAATAWFNAKTASAGYPERALYHAVHAVSGAAGEIPTSEIRNTIELAYQHHFSENLMATVMLPFSLFDVTSDRLLSVDAVGDPTLLAHYVAHDVLPIPSVLMIGGGIKLPLADHELRDAHGAKIDPRSQPGSGSLDFVLNVTGTAQFGSWTVALDAFAKLNGANNDRDRLGSSLAFSGTINRDLLRDNEAGFAVVGIAGLRSELAARDRIAGVVDPESGSTALYGSLGSEVVVGSIRLDLSVLVPVYQHREDLSQERTRILAGIRYAL
jgi:hypothetical protein